MHHLVIDNAIDYGMQLATWDNPDILQISAKVGCISHHGGKLEQFYNLTLHLVVIEIISLSNS